MAQVADVLNLLQQDFISDLAEEIKNRRDPEQHTEVSDAFVDHVVNAMLGNRCFNVCFGDADKNPDPKLFMSELLKDSDRVEYLKEVEADTHQWALRSWKTSKADRDAIEEYHLLFQKAFDELADLVKVVNGEECDTASLEKDRSEETPVVALLNGSFSKGRLQETKLFEIEERFRSDAAHLTRVTEPTRYGLISLKGSPEVER